MNREIAARDQEIARLQAMVSSLSNQLESAQQQQKAARSGDGGGGGEKRKPINLSPNAVHIQQVDADARGKRTVIRTGKQRMGRNASICTQQVMATLPSTETEFSNSNLAMRIMDMFQAPNAHVDYLNSEQFAKDILKLAQKARHVLEREPRVVYLSSPTYIIGDIVSYLHLVLFCCFLVLFYSFLSIG